MNTLLCQFAAGIALGLISGTAIAAPTQPTSEQIETPEADVLFPDSEATDDRALAKATAKQDIAAVARSNQTSNVSNNSVNGTSTTGDVSIADNAFQNASGLTIINANSGNNVSMNASMNVNIIMAPPQ